MVRCNGLRPARVSINTFHVEAFSVDVTIEVLFFAALRGYEDINRRARLPDE